MKIFCLDSNAFITSWRWHYPIDIFPSFWDQLSEKRENVALIKPIYNELKVRNDGLFEWIGRIGFRIFDLDEDVEQSALVLEGIYETNDISKGASSNDIKLIAFAMKNNFPVVTYESMQINIPGKNVITKYL